MTSRILSLLAVFILTASFAAAQTTQLGLRAGGDLSQLRGQDDVFGENNTDRKLGFSLGVFAVRPITNQLSIQPELLYTQRGGRLEEVFSEDGFDGEIESRFDLQYVQLPVLLKYHLPAQRRVHPSLYAGPYVGYAIGRDIEIEISSEGESMELSVNADEAFERFDYGAVFGIDFGYPLGRRMVYAGIRYELGLANVLKDDASFDGETALSDPTARGHDVSLTLGMTF